VAKAVENEIEALESLDPTGLWRLAFWLVWILGLLALLFTFLLAMVPRRHDDSFTLEYAIRSCLAALGLISIIMARRIWKIRNPIGERTPALAMQVVVIVAWVELTFALVSILAIAASRVFVR
jgi:hypothetical protein